MIQFWLMQYILSIIFAVLLVVAQSSWKHAVGAADTPFKTGFSLDSVVRFAVSPFVILGMLIYLAAIFLYMYLLSKYEFSFVQSIAIPLSLVFSMIVATALFGESLSLVNYVGLVVVVFGIVLITTR